MMQRRTRKLFMEIFREASVLDVDFSQWDRRVRLIVASGLQQGDYYPFHQVDFLRVISIDWRANHYGVELDSPDYHIQWGINEAEIQKDDNALRILLRGFVRSSPSTVVVCESVEISEIDTSLVDEVNPEWSRPYAPLVRPGLQDLARIWRARRREQGES